MEINLSSRIFGLVIVPLISFLVVGGISVYQNSKLYQEAQTSEINMELFDATSALIHESQKERGKSTLYVKKEISISVLESQRQLSSEKIAVYITKLKKTQLNQASIEEAGHVLKLLDSAKEATQNNQTAELQKNYSLAIAKMIELEIVIARACATKG